MVNNTTSPSKRAIKSSGQLNNRLLVMLDDLERIQHHLNVSLGMTQNPESRIDAFLRFQQRKKEILDKLVLSVFPNKRSVIKKAVVLIGPKERVLYEKGSSV
jgi:hypothetical protein